MLKRELGSLSVLGFARYGLVEGVDPAQFFAAAREWQRSFLAEQDGIAFHCLLGSTSGDYADAILATDEAAFQRMSEDHLSHPSSAPLMEMLDRDSIRLTKSELFVPVDTLPRDFTCIEFGTFRPKDPANFTEHAMMEASDRIEQKYLSNFDEARLHLMGRLGDGSYSEIAFVENSAAAREICNGYVGNEDCFALLDMFDPSSVDLDFWHVLA